MTKIRLQDGRVIVVETRDQELVVDGLFPDGDELVLALDEGLALAGALALEASGATAE